MQLPGTTNRASILNMDRRKIITIFFLQNKLSKLQHKLQSMRLVQHRLDRLNLHEDALANEENTNAAAADLVDECISLNGEEKLGLLRKLHELELKKEKMDTMIQRVQRAQKQHRSGYTFSDNASDILNERHDQQSSDRLSPNIKRNLVTGSRFNDKQYLTTNEEILSDTQPNNIHSILNDQTSFTAPSPTLSLLDNLRALEVSHETRSGGTTESLREKYMDDTKNVAKNKIKVLQSRLQNTMAAQRGSDRLVEENQGADSQISSIQNVRRLSSYQDAISSARSSESLSSPRFNIPSGNFAVNSYNMEESDNAFESTASKANVNHKSPNNNPTTGRNIPRNESFVLRQLYNGGKSARLYQQTSPHRSVAATQRQIKELENQIEFLYNEVLMASIGAESSLGQESRNIHPTQTTKPIPHRLGSNVQNSPNSSFVMLNNSMEVETDIGAHSFDHSERLGNKKGNLNIPKTANTAIPDKMIIAVLKSQEMKMEDQQKQISQLSKSMNSYLARLNVVENDVDGLHSVLRSLIDVIDHQTQPNSYRQDQSSHPVRMPINCITKRQFRDPNHSNSMNTHLLRRENQPASEIRSSIASDAGNKNIVTKLENTVQRPYLPSGPFSVNSTTSLQQRKANERQTNLETANNVGIAPPTRSAASSIGPSIPTNHLNQSFHLSSSEVNAPVTMSSANSTNYVKNDREALNTQQLYDNEPWRNFEIDMNNGLGNISLGPFLNHSTNTLQDRNLLNVEQDLSSYDGLDLDDFLTPHINRNENEPNVSSLVLEALEGFHGISEPYWARSNETSRVGASNRPEYGASDSNKEENNDFWSRSMRNTSVQKDGAKAMLPTSTPRTIQLVSSSYANSLELPGNSTTTRSALNNQVAPGRRANNYWDNFKSYSRQNRLEVTPSTSQTHILPSRPTAAVGAVTLNEDQRPSFANSSGSPMVAQVPPRQQTVLISNVVHPIPSQDTSFRPVERETNSRNPASHINIDVEYDPSLRDSSLTQTSQNASMLSNNEVDRHTSSSSLQNNQNSAFVEPYFSNAYSPSRPRRKQKINREQNREVNSSFSNLEGDNNIIQAAAMARAVANNSAAIIGSQSAVALNSSGIDMANRHPIVSTSYHSTSINDLNFHPADSTSLPFIPNALSSSALNPNIAAMVHPIPHQMNSTNQINESIGEARNTLRHPDAVPVRNQTVDDCLSDVSRITRSIFGHINNLISQTEADPEQLQKLLDNIQTSRVLGTQSHFENQTAGPQAINSTLQDDVISKEINEINEPQNIQIQGNLTDNNTDEINEIAPRLGACSFDSVEEQERNNSSHATKEPYINAPMEAGERLVSSSNANEAPKAMNSDSFEDENNVQMGESLGIDLTPNVSSQSTATSTQPGLFKIMINFNVTIQRNKTMFSINDIRSYKFQVARHQYLNQDLINTLTQFQKMFKGNGILVIGTRVAVSLQHHSTCIHRVP